jgi:hypothetical protein
MGETVYHRLRQWYTRDMPTARPRYQVTETESVAHALDVAARRWPGGSRSKLLLRLVDVGAATLDTEEMTAEDRYRDAIMASSGKYADAFGPDYLADLRRDWPA